jgi:hypothetical protein
MKAPALSALYVVCTFAFARTIRATISGNLTVDLQWSTCAAFEGSPSEYMISLDRASEAAFSTSRRRSREPSPNRRGSRGCRGQAALGSPRRSLVRMRDRLSLPAGWSEPIDYPRDLPIAYLDSIPLDFDCRLCSSASISRETMSGIAVVAFQPRTRWALAGFPALI